MSTYHVACERQLCCCLQILEPEPYTLRQRDELFVTLLWNIFELQEHREDLPRARVLRFSDDGDDLGKLRRLRLDLVLNFPFVKLANTPFGIFYARLTKLQSLPVYLDLTVLSAHIYQGPVRAVPYQIPSLVHLLRL